MRILKRFLLRQVFYHQLAILIIISVLFFIQQCMRFLSDAVSGNIPLTAILWLVTLQLPALITFVLPLSIFLGLLFALSKLSVDFEYTALRTFGVNYWRIAQLLLPNILFWMFITTLLMLWVAPYSLQARFDYFDSQRFKASITGLQAQQFNRIDSSNSMAYFEQKTSDGFREAYLLTPIIGSQYETLTATYAEVTNSDNTLMLHQGMRFNGSVHSAAQDILTFKRLESNIPQKQTHKRVKTKTLSSDVLWQNRWLPDYNAEWHWRISFSFSVLILTLCAIVMADLPPRTGRFGRFFPALGFFTLYLFLLLYSKQAIASATASSYILWMMHVIFLFATLYFYPHIHRWQHTT